MATDLYISMDYITMDYITMDYISACLLESVWRTVIITQP
jgi:hypothetical protein